MKKIYLQPEMESLSMNMAWALCSGSDPIGDNTETGNPGAPGPPSVGGGAPGRKVF